MYRDRAPLRRNIEAAEVGDTCLFLVERRLARHHLRDPFVDAGYHIMGMRWPTRRQ